MLNHKILPKIRLVLILFIISSVSAQLYIPADPIDLLFTEQKIMMGGDDPGSLMIRPVIPPIKQSKNVWSIKVRNELFYNSGGPNLENTSDRWIGNGISLFTSANITYNSDFTYSLDDASIRTLTLTDAVSENYWDFYSLGNNMTSNLLENTDEYSYSTTIATSTLTL